MSLCKERFKDSFYQGPYVKDSLRTRLVKDTMERILEGLVWSRTLCKANSVKKPLVLQYPSTKVAKNHWFYSIRQKKYQKTSGFTVSIRKSIKQHWFYSIRLKKYQKTIGFTVSVRKMWKNRWFYRLGNQKSWKTIGFTDRATKNVEKPLVLL